MGEIKGKGYEFEELLKRNIATFTKTGTFCATCGAFGLTRHPETKQHGIRLDWESFKVSRLAADKLASVTQDHALRRDRDLIVPRTAEGHYIIFQLCVQCAVVEGVETQDPEIN